MLDSSLEFKQLIRNNTSCSASGKITFSNGKSLDLSGKDFMGGTMQFEHASSSTGSFEIGAAIVGTMSCTLNNSDEKFSEYDFSGAVISAIVNKTLSNTTEVIPKGIYNIEKPETIGRTIQIKAYDNMIKFSKSYSDVKTVYPASLQTILNDVCTYCGVILNTQRFDHYDYVISERPDEDTITCLDVVSFVAQIAGCFAKINTSGKLELIWYGTNIDKYSITDGGTFKTVSTPYSDGDHADGGNFKDYSSGDNVNGGAFTDKVPYLLYGFSTKKINTDDVVITGIKVTVDEKNSYLYGNDSYALEISNNKFITEKNMKEIATMIGTKVVGMKFRPFSASVLSDPTLEPGDAVNLFVDGNIYFSYLTRTSYTMGNYENVECSAESPISKSCVNYGSSTKMLEAAKKDAAKKISAYDVQMQMLTNLMTNSFGVFKTEEVKEDGSIIYYLHNKQNLSDSSTIWKMTADAMAVSTDGGKTWNAGIDKDGNAVVNVLSAIGINFDWARGGTLTLGGKDNGNGVLHVVDGSGNVLIILDRFGIKLSDGTSLSSGLIHDKESKSSWNLNTGVMHVSGTFSQETNAGVKSLDIQDNQVKFYAWNDDGNYVGSVGAIKNTASDRAGIEMWCDQGDTLSLGCLRGDGRIDPVVKVDANTYKDKTPYIRNGANGTMFNGCGDGVTVENGLIKSWNMPTVSGNPSFISGLSWTDGKITSVTRTTLNVSNGLITGWSSEKTDY